MQQEHTETPTYPHAGDGPELGPAWGMKFRHHVRGYALEQKRQPGPLGRGWHELLLLDNGELAEVIGHAVSPGDAVEKAQAWLGTSRVLSPRVS